MKMNKKINLVVGLVVILLTGLVISVAAIKITKGQTSFYNDIVTGVINLVSERLLSEGNTDVAVELGGSALNRNAVRQVGNFNAISLKDSDSDMSRIDGIEYAALPTTATSTDFFCNKSGQTIYADDVILQLDGTASSTHYYYVSTTTTAGLAWDATPAAQIISFTLATSTATSTINNKKSGGADVLGLTRVLNNECVSLLIKAVEAGCTGSRCESATSTNQGITGFWSMKWFAFRNPVNP